MKTIHPSALLGACVLLPILAFAQPPRPPMGGRSPMGGRMMRSAKGRLPHLIMGAARLSGPEALSKRQARRPIGLRPDRPRGGGRPNRPDFAARPGGPPMGAMRAMMESYNPLYGGASGMESQLPPRMQEGMQRRRDRLNTALEQVRQRAR